MNYRHQRVHGSHPSVWGVVLDQEREKRLEEEQRGKTVVLEEE